MRPVPNRIVATLVLALAFVTTSGCGVDDSPKSPSKSGARSSANARCAGSECRVRVVCKGKVHMRYGAAPVQIRTSKTALVTTVFADFAGSSDDAKVRC